jgi:hypothetical protein
LILLKKILSNGQQSDCAQSKSAMKEKAITEPTWKPYSQKTPGGLTAAEKASLPASAFAFPSVRKEPMTDPAHVRDAMARFDQVSGVTDTERDLAFANFQKAAGHFGIKMKETDWHQFGS